MARVGLELSSLTSLCPWRVQSQQSVQVVLLLIQQTRSTREHDTSAERPPPAVHHTNNESSNDPCASWAHCVTSHGTSPITTLQWLNNMTVCHMLSNVFLSRSRSTRQCLMTRTDIKATVYVRTSCTVVSLSTTCVDFNNNEKKKKKIKKSRKN